MFTEGYGSSRADFADVVSGQTKMQSFLINFA